jgi:hypothetical protein
MGGGRSAQRECADRVRIAAGGSEEAKRPLELTSSHALKGLRSAPDILGLMAKVLRK